MSQSLPENHNEFRSDTFTTPTPEMISSISLATVGDSVYNEDADTLALEEKVRALTGHEAGLYCVSGTLSNQIALRAHLKQPPHSILCDYRSHVFTSEAGGLATLSQAMVVTVHPSNGLYLTLEDIVKNYVKDDGNIHLAPTRVISLENTLHGLVMPIEEIKRISQWCRSMGLILHLDGARIWNASAKTGISLKEYGQYFDSISLCLSKSLGAPIGSVLVGSKSFIKVANHFKKQNGGGIRQAGFLCRMASIAIDKNFAKLNQANDFALEFSNYCENDLKLKLECPTDTNFVFLDSIQNKIDPILVNSIGEKYNIKAFGFRFAFSYQTSREAVTNLKKTMADVVEAAKIKPYEGDSISSVYMVVDEKK